MIKIIFCFIFNGILAINILPGQDLLAVKMENTTVITETPSKSPSLFQFKAYPKDSYLEGISSEVAGIHPFGDLVAKKLFLFDKYYTSEENPFPGNPAVKTIVKKPVIYTAVKDIERNLKKSVRKGSKPKEEASLVMNTVLDVALNIITADTKSFESALKASGNIDLKIDLFTRKVKLNY